MESFHDKQIRLVARVIEHATSRQIDPSTLAELNGLRDNLVEAKANGSEDGLASFLKGNPVWSKIIGILSTNALDFIADQLSEFKRIKARRPLTESEQRSARECVKILDELRGLVGQTASPKDES